MARAKPIRCRWPPDSTAAAGTDIGVVALGEAQDHFMDAGQLGGLDHLLRVHLAETGDVVGDGPLEKLDVLRQATDGRPQFLLVPGGDIGPVRGPCRSGQAHADHEAGQGGLAGSGKGR